MLSLQTQFEYSIEFILAGLQGHLEHEANLEGKSSDEEDEKVGTLRVLKVASVTKLSIDNAISRPRFDGLPGSLHRQTYRKS